MVHWNASFGWAGKENFQFLSHFTQFRTKTVCSQTHFRANNADAWKYLSLQMKKVPNTGASPIVGSAANGSTIEATSMQPAPANASAASIPADSTTARPIVDPSTKQGPQLRTKQHYVNAMLCIVIVLGVIAVVLSVCTGYACYLSKRRKRTAFSVYGDSSTTPLHLRVLQERDGITLEL